MNNDSTGRILEALRAWVAAAPSGARLPSSRALVAEHGASPVTVQRAMRALVLEGLIESRPGVGSFVLARTSRQPIDFGWQAGALGPQAVRLGPLSSTQRSAAPDAISLHSGYPTGDLLPERLVRAALGRVARTPAAVTRTPVAGLPELRQWFAGELARHASGDATPPAARDVVVLSGSQSGLSSIFRAVVGPGQPLLVESPTYWGAIVAAAQAGVTLVPVPSGPAGPDPDDVARALAETGARGFYAQPTYANPTGAQWSDDVGRAVLEAVRGHGAFLVEDDWAHDLAIDTDPHPLAAHDPDGHVVYLRSLTKSVSPALRVAALVARGPVRERILADRAAESMYVSGLLQAAALDVVTQPGWRTHLRAVRPALRGRRDALLTALRERAPALHVAHVPDGGLNLWCRLPDGTDPVQVARACEARGVVVAPGDEWFPAEPSGPYLRLNYAGPDPDRFDEAAAVLGAVLADAV